MRAGLTALPHHDATITSGARRTTSSAATIRSLASAAPRSSGNTGSPPAISHKLFHPSDARDQRVVPLLEVHAGTPWPSRRRLADRLESRREFLHQLLGAILPADEAADDQDHLQDLVDRSLVEREDGMAAPDELGGDIRLQVRESQDQVRTERLDLLEVRVDERRDARLLARLRRPHGVPDTPTTRSPSPSR